MTDSPATSTPEASTSNPPSTSLARSSVGSDPKRSELVTDEGKTSIADTVVAKIAGLACREVSGVHDMGAGMSRTFGSIKDMIPVGSTDPSPTRGVNVEVGERQAAIDLDIVVEYGASIVDIAAAIRRNVIGRLESMTGLEVSEVNVTVDDVYLGESESDGEPRVQ
jgi:uncharacterized alkaline shock family protein YloU